MVGVPDSFSTRKNLGLTKLKLRTLSDGFGRKEIYLTGSYLWLSYNSSYVF